MAAVNSSLWQRIIQQVVVQGGNIIRPWFTQLEPISLDHGLLEIEVPGRAEQEYCRQHAVRLFTEAAQAATGRLVGVCFLTAAQRSEEGPSQTFPAPAGVRLPDSLCPAAPLNLTIIRKTANIN